MVEDERMTERCRLLRKRRIKVTTLKRGSRLSDCRLEASKVQHRLGPACLCDDKPMEVEHLGQVEVAH
jgi:hypothetical protein